MIPSVEPTVAFPSLHELIKRVGSPVTPKSETVDLWSVSLQESEAVLERCHAWLSEEERTRAARFVRSEDQTRFTLARGGLRVVLARYLAVDPLSLRFQAGPTGKPVLLDSQESAHVLRFNLAHSDGRMLVAVANGLDVGIDLEHIRDNLEAMKLAERFYSPAEYEWIKSRPSSDHFEEFYRLWVAKEAVLKAQGTGLAWLQQCEVLATASSSRGSVRLRHDSALQERWTIQWVNCGPRWQAAVSAYGHHWSVRVLEA